MGVVVILLELVLDLAPFSRRFLRGTVRFLHCYFSGYGAIGVKRPVVAKKLILIRLTLLGNLSSGIFLVRVFHVYRR